MKTEWVHKKLIDLADYYNGMAFKPSDWVESGTKIIRIEQLNNPMGNYDYYQGSYPEINAIQNEDLIFSWSATLKVAIWKWGEGVLNQHLFKVVPFENVDKYFLYYLLDYNMPKLGESSHGSTMKHIKRKELETYSVRIPTTLPAQRRIAAILSSADKVIASTQKVIAKYKQMKQGLMEDLLEPREGWKMVKLGECCDIITGPFGSSLHEKDYTKDGIPVINPQNIVDHKIIAIDSCLVNDETIERLSKYKLKIGDIVIARRGEMGRCAVVEENQDGWLCGTGCFAIKVHQEKVNAHFLQLQLCSESTKVVLENNSIGATMSNLNQSILYELEIDIPSLSEQQRIVSILSGIDAKIAVEEKVLEKYEKVKKGLMERLLEGKS